MSNELVLIETQGQQMLCTQAQKEAIESLMATPKGGIAVVHGYQPKTNWVKIPTQDISFISRIDYFKLLERKLVALKAVTLADIKDYVANDEKLSVLSSEKLTEAFEARKGKLIASLENSLKGDEKEKNAHHIAHETFYQKFDNGIKVHFETIKEDGATKRVTFKGVPIVKSIMLSYLQLNVKTIVEGERKVVNNGVPVRIEKCINKVLNQKSIGLKTLSLGKDNFESLSIGKQKLTNEQFESVGDLII